MTRTLKILSVLFSIAIATDGSCDELKETFIAKGITARTEGYVPLQAKMDLDATIATEIPEGLSNAKFGQIKLQNQSWIFALVEPEDAPAQLLIDCNGDKDLTNDPPAEWVSREVSGSKQYSSSAMVRLENGKWGSVRFYRFDAADPRRGSLKNVMMYYADFGSELNFELDGQSFSTILSGQVQPGQSLPINRDANKRISRYYEISKIGEPFNFTGSTYVFDLEAGQLSLGLSKEAVPQLPLPPDFSIGKSAIPFSGLEMDGGKIEFPKDYAGKLVMLDFWATWCGPCIGEVPHMKQAYADWHTDGFEILGVCLDSAGSESVVQKFLAEKEIEWEQLYDDEKKPLELTRDYDILGIPFVLLVDGDSGEIVATSRELRGAGLSKVIGSMLKKKRGLNNP